MDVRPDPHKKYIADIEEDARRGDDFEHQHEDSASKSSIRRFLITEKAPTRAFSWFLV